MDKEKRWRFVGKPVRNKVVKLVSTADVEEVLDVRLRLPSYVDLSEWISELLALSHLRDAPESS